MLLGIDHVVIAVEDPDAAAADLERVVGLRASGGGRHESLGTYNRLVWLGDSYLELIGVFDARLAEQSWIGAPALRALSLGGGIVSWAIAVDSIQRAAAAWPTLTDAYRAPIDGERLRPDGRVVRWQLAIAGPLGVSEPPFLIEHDTTAAEWTPAERAARAREAHPLGSGVRLAGLTLAVANRHALATRVATLLGIEFSWAGGGLETRLGGPVVRLEAEAGAGEDAGGRKAGHAPAGRVPGGRVPAGRALAGTSRIRLAIPGASATRLVELFGCSFAIEPAAEAAGGGNRGPRRAARGAP